MFLGCVHSLYAYVRYGTNVCTSVVNCGEDSYAPITSVSALFSQHRTTGSIALEAGAPDLANVESCCLSVAFVSVEWTRDMLLCVSRMDDGSGEGGATDGCWQSSSCRLMMQIIEAQRSLGFGQYDRRMQVCTCVGLEEAGAGGGGGLGTFFHNLSDHVCM